MSISKPRHPPAGRALQPAFAVALAASVAACSPSHDWRNARSADDRVQALFPCKPQLHERQLPLAGGPVKLSLMACQAGGQTWGLATADVVDPSRQSAALAELAAAAGANVSATASAATFSVPGATPHPGARRLHLQGHRPDGQPVRMQMAVFVYGTRVYQATALGERLPDESVDTFFGSLRVMP